MGYFFNNIRNSFDFFLRSHITFSRKNYTEKSVNIKNALKNEEEQQLFNILSNKYDLTTLYELNEINFLTNLYYLSLFDKHIFPQNTNNLKVLDIGSKNWNYAKSEYIFFKFFTDKLNLNGIELDAYRLCTNFYNRYETAKFYTKNIENSNYIIGDFLNHNEKYDYIIWILPFITEYPHIKWGLPLKYFKPEKMLNHAYNLLNPNGEILIINQGEEEYNIQKQLNENLGLSCEYYGEIVNVINPYKNKRFCSKIIKKQP